jgi:TonB family protein
LAPRSAKIPLLLLCALTSWSARVLAQETKDPEPAPGDRGSGAVPRGGSGAVTRPPPEDDNAPKPPVVVPPKLVHFEHAPYPEEAQKDGVQGDVVLKLTIDAEGHVTNAEVTEGIGHGLDEAAQAAALKFLFEPATRNGKPVAAKILYRYSFTLTPAEPGPGPGPGAPVKPEPPKTGNLGGALRIAGTNVPLAGAEVVVTAPDGTTRRLSTDVDGKWNIDGVPPGKYKVKLASTGYQSTENEEEVFAGEATEITYRLAPESEGFEVTVQGERPPREVTRRTLERREIARIPGTSGDALRSIQNLPGVARPPGLAGLLIVRGSAPQDTMTFVDGAAVPLIYHFGGLSSVIPTELLDKIDFYPGNFSARYGRVMGGIVDVGLRSPDTRCNGPYMKPTDRRGCYHALAQVDLIDARALVQGPLGPVKGWTFAAGVRRSWIDAWLKPVLEASGAGVTTAPVYWDYQVLTETKPARNSKLSVRAYGADDQLEILIRDPLASDPIVGGDINFETGSHRVQALYTGELSRDVELTSMLSVGKNLIRFSLGNLFFDLDTYPVDARTEFGFKVSRGFKLYAGYDFEVAPYEVRVRAPQPPREGEPNPGPFATRPPVEIAVKSTAYRPAWYLEGEITPIRRLRLVPGARVDYARDSGHADFSPRINARFDLVPSFASQEDESYGRRQRRTTLKGGVGVFQQPPQFQETSDVFGTPGLYSNRAIHYSLGVEQELTRQVDVSVEGFYKDMSRLVARNPTANGSYEYNNDGLGSVIGLETLLKYKPDSRFFGWIAYTLSRSVRQSNADAPERLFQFDQTHNLILLGSYRLGRGWEFGARFRLVSGSLTTPLVARPALPALYAADAGTYARLSGQPYSRRLPLFHQLDVRVDKSWQFQDWRFSAYLDVYNVYNNQAVEALVYNYNYTQENYQTGLPIIPSIGIRGEF